MVVLYKLGKKVIIQDIYSKFEIIEGIILLFTLKVIKILKFLKNEVII